MRRGRLSTPEELTIDARSRALQIVAAEPAPTDDQAIAPVWHTPDGRVEDARPPGATVPMCSSLCPWRQTPLRHSADEVLGGDQPTWTEWCLRSGVDTAASNAICWAGYFTRPEVDQ